MPGGPRYWTVSEGVVVFAGAWVGAAIGAWPDWKATAPGGAT